MAAIIRANKVLLPVTAIIVVALAMLSYAQDSREGSKSAASPAREMRAVSSDARDVSAAGGFGACCHDLTGECTIEVDAGVCGAIPGTYLGDNTSCTPNCCPQPVSTGADDCAAAIVNEVPPLLPGESIAFTLTGDNSGASGPDTCDELDPDPVWWEAIDLGTNCARITLDFSCMSGGLNPAYDFLFSQCPCTGQIEFATESTSDVDGGTTTLVFENLPAGIYYYPIYSDSDGTVGPYQISVAVERCPEAACCYLACVGGANDGSLCIDDAACPGGACDPACELLNQLDCHALGGHFQGPPERFPATTVCTPAVCSSGSCCTGGGSCEDHLLGLPLTKDDCDFLGGTYIGGIRCAGGTCAGGSNDGLSCSVGTDCPGGSCTGSAEELAQPNPCPDGDATNFEFEQWSHSNGTVVVTPDSEWGQMAFDIVPTTDGSVSYLNVTATPNAGGCTGWIIRNYPILPSELIDPGRFFTPFNFEDMCLTRGDAVASLDAVIELSSVPRQAGPIGSTTLFLVTNTTVVRQGETLPGGNNVFTDASSLTPPHIKTAVDTKKIKKYKDMPGVQEKVDECGAGATARSLKWLSDRHGYGLPGVGAIKNALVKCMGAPTSTKKRAQCKLKYIKNNPKLCLEVHHWYSKKKFPKGIRVKGVPEESNTDIDMIDFLYREMCRGQDVELAIQWAGGGAHVITLVGIDKKKKTIEYRDDVPQGNDAKGDEGYKEAKLISLGKGQYGFKAKGNLIYSAMAESPKPDPHATTPGFSTVGFGAAGGGARPAIPADFFGPGSLPFEGTITLGGAPIDGVQSGNASTGVQRYGIPVTPEDSDGTQGIVDIEIVELKLVSTAPITVSGTVDTQWHVQVSLSDIQQQRGTLTATKTHGNGGTFDATLPVQPKFTFTQVGDPSNVRVLDTGLEDQQPIAFATGGVPFVFNSNPDLGIHTPHEGEFVPGVLEIIPGDIGSQVAGPTDFVDPIGPTQHRIEPPKKPDPHGTRGGPGNTFVGFGVGGNIPPIPADFFDPGSDPFIGQIDLKGNANGVADDAELPGLSELFTANGLGNASTLVVRSGAPVSPNDSNGTAGSVDIEIVALSLVSISPINVGTGQWHVALGLSEIPAPIGTLTATKNHANGGTFDASLFVQPRFVFTRVANPSDVRVLDTGLRGEAPVSFTVAGVPFVFNLNPLFTNPQFTIAPYDGVFVPGIEEVVPGDPNSQRPAPAQFDDPTSPARHTVDPPVPPDPHATPTIPGATQVSFGLPGSNPPIPADFFGPGSDPFTGTVDLRGQPIDSGRWGNASTLVQRSGTPIQPNDPNGTMGTVEIEIIQLNLVSLQPITVTSNGGADPELWKVEVGIGDGVLPGGLHEIQALKTHANGGTFDMHYTFNPVLTFTKLSDPTDVRVFEDPDAGFVSVHFAPQDVPFVHTVNPALGILAPSNGTFVPGVREVVPGDINTQQAESLLLEDPNGPTRHTIEPPKPQPEPDPHGTVDAPGANQVLFGGDTIPPIPQDFFGPGSDPFLGTIQLGGDPFDPDIQGTTSVRVQRSDTPISPSEPPGTNANVEIQIVELGLQSSNPIIVTFNGGQNPEPWDVQVQLSELPSPPGQMFVQKTHNNGGFFDTTLPVLPRFIFTRADNPNETRLLDAAAEEIPPILFNSGGTPWVHLVNPALVVTAPSDGEFVPGIEETIPGDLNSQVPVPMELVDGPGETRHTVEPVFEGTPPCVCDPDVDGSGGVNFLDAAEVVSCIGQPASCNPDADVNCDGVISEADLGIVVEVFRGADPGDACARPVGACCLDSDNSCVIEQQSLCDGDVLFPQFAGTYQGDGSNCDPDPCGTPPLPLVADDVCSGGTNDGNPCSENGECPGGGVCGSKNRYLSFNIPEASNVATGVSYAVRVEILSMPQFPARVGEVWWGGPDVAVPNPPFGTVTGSGLECTATPHMQVWKGLGTIHCFGEAVTPESVYGVSLCTSPTGPCSPSKPIQTGKWGDMVAIFGGVNQPNFADITACVDSFKGLLSAPPITRTDLVPQVPNGVANFADITAAVDGFKGFAYPYTPPACP